MNFARIKTIWSWKLNHMATPPWFALAPFPLHWAFRLQLSSPEGRWSWGSEGSLLAVMVLLVRARCFQWQDLVCIREALTYFQTHMHGLGATAGWGLATVCFWRNVFLLAWSMVSMVTWRASPLRGGCAWHPHKPSITGLRRIQSQTNRQVSAAPGHGCCISGSFYHACSRGCRLLSFTT